LLRWLLPKKTEFFDLFSRHAALGVEGALLVQALVDDPTDAEEKAKRIRRVEHVADDVCQETLEMVHRSFVTPFERSHIYEITSRLDDVLDNLEEAAQRIWLYEIERATPEGKEMASHLVSATRALQAAVDGLGARRDPDQVRAHCSQVKHFENENDRLLRRATARLFKEEDDPKTLIKWKEIYQDFEEAIDRCEDVANVIEAVLLENA
jgi:hypothetical protein